MPVGIKYKAGVSLNLKVAVILLVKFLWKYKIEEQKSQRSYRKYAFKNNSN